MESKSNYTLVGVIVILLGTGLLFAAIWLSNGFSKKHYDLYTVFLNEPAAGLSEESIVKFNGVPVGFVKKIKLSRNDPRQVELILDIEQKTPITTSTFATLISQGITGVTYVGLSAASSDLTPLQKLPDEPYPVIPARPSMFNQLDSMLKNVSVSIGRVTKQAQLIFNEENAEYIKHSLMNLERFSGALAQNSASIDMGLKSAAVFFKNASEASRGIPDMMNKIKLGGEHLSETMLAGKNAVNKLSHQALPPAISLLNRWNDISANLQKISNAMRQNPSVVIRGSMPPKSGPGE